MLKINSGIQLQHGGHQFWKFLNFLLVSWVVLKFFLNLKCLWKRSLYQDCYGIVLEFRIFYKWDFFVAPLFKIFLDMHMKKLIFTHNQSALQQTIVSKQILADWYGRQITSFFQNIVEFWSQWCIVVKHILLNSARKSWNSNFSLTFDLERNLLWETKQLSKAKPALWVLSLSLMKY